MQVMKYGDILNNQYKIHRILKKKDDSNVYQVINLKNDQILVIKETTLSYNSEEEKEECLKAFEKIFHTAKLLAERPENTFLIKHYGYFFKGDYIYMVTEFVDGMDLETYIGQKEQLTTEEVFSWIKELLTIMPLFHYHKPEGHFFKNLDPSHLVINKKGLIKLVNVGFSYYFSSPDRFVRTPFSAPESDFSEQSDLYSVGAMIYYFMTRKKPKPSDYIPPSQINPIINPELESIINKALDRSPSQRFSSAGSFKTQIEHYQHKMAKLSVEQEEKYKVLSVEPAKGLVNFNFSVFIGGLLFILFLIVGYIFYINHVK